MGWQIDNELNCDLSEFYSQSDHEAFREYLKKKFVTLDNLNDSLGMTFWNRTYSDWEQVTLNKKCVGGAVNPHLALEEKRFFSESAIAFCEIQVKAIRKHIPEGKFITTNGLFANLDYNRLLECGLDFITYDSYPNFAFDLMKDGVDGFKDRKWSWNLMWTRSVSPVFGIMEQQAGANGWSTRMETPAPKPGQMRLWTMQSIAHGADMVTYFRWRTSPIGCEIYWHGLNDYANTESRRMRELQTIGEEVARLEPIRGTIYKADVAVLKDYSNAWDAASDCWHGRIDSYSDNSWFEATQISHTPADFRFIRPETTLEELSAYKLLVYPHPAILESQTAGLLKEYVSNGGVLVCGARTGYKDAFGRCPMRPMPGIISEWCGATVRDYTLVGPEDGEIIIDWDDLSLPAPVFNEVLDVHDAEVLGHFKGSYYDGAPAFCRKALGAGYVYYLGSCFSAGMARAIIEKTGRLAPYSHVLELSNTMELAVRSDGSRDYLFVLNYGGEAAKITLKRTLKELLSGQMLDGIIEMLPYGVAVFELE